MKNKPLIALAIIIALVIIGVVYSRSAKTATEPQEPLREVTSDELTAALLTFEIQEIVHVDTDEEHDAYNSNPPTSGWHYARPADWGVYTEELADELFLHNVEHGGAWISYTGISDEDVAALKKLTRQNDGAVVMSPRAANDNPIAVVTWGKMIVMDTPDIALIQAFIDTYKNQTHEPFAK